MYCDSVSFQRSPKPSPFLPMDSYCVLDLEPNTTLFFKYLIVPLEVTLPHFLETLMTALVGSYRNSSTSLEIIL